MAISCSLVGRFSAAKAIDVDEKSFTEAVEMIQAARGRALTAVNVTMIDLYWRFGESISHKLASAVWGDDVAGRLVGFIRQRHPNLRGFTLRNLFRMRQFFEAYSEAEEVSALQTQLPWTHHAPPKTTPFLRLALLENLWA
jgi:hypothetical protein